MTSPPDTLPEWLFYRFRGIALDLGTAWEKLSEADQLYWKHEANAVRRAVARNGFKHLQPPNEGNPV